MSPVVCGRRRAGVQGDAPRLEGLEVIWRQQPKTTGRGHYGHRLAFSPDGRHLFIASGDRQKMTPAQDMTGNLGKVVRLLPDGRDATPLPRVEVRRAHAKQPLGAPAKSITQASADAA